MTDIYKEESINIRIKVQNITLIFVIRIIFFYKFITFLYVFLILIIYAS